MTAVSILFLLIQIHVRICSGTVWVLYLLPIVLSFPLILTFRVYISAFLFLIQMFV